jgi:hypothetical protein
MPEGVMVSRVRIVAEFDVRTGGNKPYLLILRDGSNIVDIKAIERNGYVEHLATVRLAAMDPESFREL